MASLSARPTVHRSIGPLACGLLLLLGGPACNNLDMDGPRPTSVEPGQVENTSSVKVRIRGMGFYPSIQANYDDESRSSVRTSFSASLGPSALQQVRFVSTIELSAVVPAGLAPGWYDLTVIDPRQRRGELERAFQVLARPIADGGREAGIDLDGGPTDGQGDRHAPLDGPSPDALADSAKCLANSWDANAVPTGYTRCAEHTLYGGIGWPVGADVAGPCVDAASTPWPVTGPGAANWFVYGGCGQSKEYRADKGCVLVLSSSADCCSGCSLKEISYTIEEQLPTGWTQIQVVKEPKVTSCSDPLTHVLSYTPSPPAQRVRIKNQGAGFYLCVYEM